MSEQIKPEELAKSAKELLEASTKLAKSQICTGSQPKVSHPENTTKDQVEGDAVEDNGTDYKGGKPRKQSTALRKALMEKIANGEVLSKAEQFALADLIDGEVVEKSEEVVTEAVTKEVDPKELEKGIETNKDANVDAAPALNAFAVEISKSHESLAKEINELKKGVAVSLENISKGINDKVDAYIESHEEFFVNHAQVSVGIAKSLEDYFGVPARGARSDNTQVAAAAGEEVKKGITDAGPQVDNAQLANVMADVLTTGRSGEFGMTEDELSKAVLSLETTKRIDPSVAKKFIN